MHSVAKPKYSVVVTHNFRGESEILGGKFPPNSPRINTEEDTGKSMKNALYVLRYAKRHLSGRSDVEQ